MRGLANALYLLIPYVFRTCPLDLEPAELPKHRLHVRAPAGHHVRDEDQMAEQLSQEREKLLDDMKRFEDEKVTLAASLEDGASSASLDRRRACGCVYAPRSAASAACRLAVAVAACLRPPQG